MLLLIVSTEVLLLIFSAVMLVLMSVYREPPGVGVGIDEWACAWGA